MTLGELLDMLSENKNVNVWLNGQMVARYDGRDSISEHFNHHFVDRIDCYVNEFHIYII